MSLNGQAAGVSMGFATVTTTENRGYTVDELTDMTMRRLVYVADDSPFKDQAQAFTTQLRVALRTAIVQAHTDERLTIAGNLLRQGLPEMAEVVRKMETI